jgi:hypothetical protein
VSEPATDSLTAPVEAIPRSGPRVTLADCWRDFIRRTPPRMLVGAMVAALALRLALGSWGWRDLVIAGGLVAAQPFTDLITAREHRGHHEHPANLDGVLVPWYGQAAFIPLIAVVMWAGSFAIHPLLGGDRLAGVATAILTGYAIFFTYEWCHFLIHAPYVPRRAYFKSIRRSHRLHHYKNERYWFGVTSNMGDRVIGTHPEPGEVDRSRTARDLHAEAERVGI